MLTSCFIIIYVIITFRGNYMESKLYEVNEYKKIVEDLLNGEVVGFPTETVYGLAIIFDDKSSFDKLYEIKNRSITKPISMMVSNRNIIEQVAYVNKIQQKVIDNLMPGALTIILNAKEDLPEHVTFNYPTVGVRIPTNEVALKILKEVNKPLLVTSANISNEPSLIKYEDVYKKFNGKIASLIKQDAINGIASSVVDLTTSPIKVLREGPVSLNDILKVIGE